MQHTWCVLCEVSAAAASLLLLLLLLLPHFARRPAAFPFPPLAVVRVCVCICLVSL